MGLTFTDTFGPVLAKSAGLHNQLAKATANNAYLVHRNVTERIENSKYQGTYKSLNERYLAYKLKNNKSSKILISTGYLFRSITVFKHSEDRFEVGTNAKYAGWMENGNVKRNIPARPFFRPGFEDSFEDMKNNWKEALRATFEK